MAHAASQVIDAISGQRVGRRYVLSVGHGSSGTKRVFNFLHHSAQTHCRWGPHSLRGSPFNELPSAIAFTAAEEPAMSARWDAAISWICDRFSLEERDGLPVPPKHHLYPVMRRLFMSLATPQRTRALLRRVVPTLREPEWNLPLWLGDSRKLSHALLAVRMGQVPAWAAWVLRNRPKVIVIHVVRHPAAYLHAWWGRFGRHQDQDALMRRNRDRLRSVVDVHPEWNAEFGDIDSLTAREAELAFWRYSTETIHAAGEGRTQYELVRDEEVVDDAVAVGRRLYARCDLEWTPEIEEIFVRKAIRWKRSTAAAGDVLDQDGARLVEAVLKRDVMRGWWSSDQTVSLFGYEF